MTMKGVNYLPRRYSEESTWEQAYENGGGLSGFYDLKRPQQQYNPINPR